MVWTGPDPIAPATLQPQPFKKEWKADTPAARFEYFFKLWQPKPVQKESKSPNQNLNCWIEIIVISQIWILFEALAGQTCPTGIKITKPEDQIWHGLNRSWSYSARNPSAATIQEGMKSGHTSSQIWILFQALAAQTCPKGIKVTKPGDLNCWMKWL